MCLALTSAWSWDKEMWDSYNERGKIVKSEGIKLPDGEVMKQVGQEGYTYVGIIELDKVKETEMKEKITNEYKRRLRLILKSKLNERSKVMAINI